MTEKKAPMPKIPIGIILIIKEYSGFISFAQLILTSHKLYNIFFESEYGKMYIKKLLWRELGLINGNYHEINREAQSYRIPSTLV